MSRYYAVCNVNGPISVRIDAATEDAAIAAFEAGDGQRWVDDARAHAEDDLEIEDCAEASEHRFAEALEAAGCERVCDLAPAHNYQAGTSGHICDGWMLWRAPDESPATDAPDTLASPQQAR